ncbi:MAG: rhomboid family intramembrane serine protease [Candidatus Melainabacteria bacterium]|nr:rhomboid family intramembrane serine protease [Candidatus Melainabacteria bacterium]
MQNENYVTYDPRLPKYKTYLTKIIIYLILFMYLAELYFNAIYSDKAIILLGAKWNEGITNGQYWRFITPTFLHGNLIHLFLNLFAVHIFGTELESIYGSIRFSAVFLLTSWGAILASYTFSSGIAIGASGTVFGIIGCLVVFYFKQRKKVSGAIMRFKSMYTLVIINLVFGFLIPKIDNFAHLGGLITGIIIGWFLCPAYYTEKNELTQIVTVNEKSKPFSIAASITIVASLLYLLTKYSIGLHIAKII